MSEHPVRDRRAGGATGLPTGGRFRGMLAAVRAGLFRILATDDDRAVYWVRHVRIGIVVSESSAVAFATYVLLTGGPEGVDLRLLSLAALVAVATPAVLLLPLRAMMRDWRGPAFFYAWSVLVSTVVITATHLDGGAASPLDALLFLSLTYTGVAHTPQGVVATGALMTVGYLLFVELPGFSSTGAFFLAIMVVFTLVNAMASANSWAAYDRQVMLIRAQEMLASTDPLTGIPNRRLFLERLARAVEASAWGHESVVLLVDLDGFKAVNDAECHAAGDALLTAVASALGGAVRETDTVARLGGDEFAVLADVTAAFFADLLADRLLEAVSVTGARYGVTASVGVAEIEPGDDVEDLMHRADVAMYQAKSSGGDRVRSSAV